MILSSFKRCPVYRGSKEQCISILPQKYLRHQRGNIGNSFSTWQEIVSREGSEGTCGTSLEKLSEVPAVGSFGTVQQVVSPGTGYPVVNSQKLAVIREINHRKVLSTQSDLLQKGVSSNELSYQWNTPSTIGTCPQRGYPIRRYLRYGGGNPWQIPEILSVTIQSSVTNSQEKGGLTSSLLARGYTKTKSAGGTPPKVSTHSKESKDYRENTRLDFHLQVKQGLQILSGQSVFESKYRVSRPSLGIRANKLATYRVTLRGPKIISFLLRFSKLWSVDKVSADPMKYPRYPTVPKVLAVGSCPQRGYPIGTADTYGRVAPTVPKVPTEGAYGKGGTVSTFGTPFSKYKSPTISIPGVKNSSSAYLNDGSKSESFEDKSLPFWFDKTGNFHCGLSSLFKFEEIETNPKLHSLANCGCIITIRTSASTNSQTKLLLSQWGILI